MSSLIQKIPVAPQSKPLDKELESAITSALSRIAPLWPLKHFVAVNPFAGFSHLPFAEACALLGQTTGAAPLQSPEDYLAAWRCGEITAADLESAACSEWSAERLLKVLENADSHHKPLMISTVADMLDEERPHAHWSAFVTEEISKWCAVTFDSNQTTWRSPWRSDDLFTAWLQAASHDLNPEAFGLTGFRKFVRGLPDDSFAAIRHCMNLLAPKQVNTTDFLHRQLCSISGWAGHVKYLVREDDLRGCVNHALRHLLAIRLAYDAALHNAFAKDGVFRANWRHQKPSPHAPTLLDALVRWQNAYENGYQRRLAASLAAQPSAKPTMRPAFQAVFCIDVRSEVFRRHLEAAAPGIQTIGFAGFFGFPIAHQSAAEDSTRSRCPVLLVPPVKTWEPLPKDEARSVKSARAAAGSWKAFQNSAASCFSFVEAAGLAFAAALGSRKKHDACCGGHSQEPCFDGTSSAETQASLAEGALRNMGLTSNFSRLVLICGHGSQSANNPYASGLDCGACGGHAGDVNARLAASTLNNPTVRDILRNKGIDIPRDTHFIAGLHNTSTDEVAFFNETSLPAGHDGDLSQLKSALHVAGDATRAERAPSLGLGALPADQLGAAVRERACDISQVRPEWGLANNAAIVAAPRSRTASLKLDGRVFLHDYDAAADPDNKVLALILCAPVVVASWINLQYYASRVDPQRYGSGNKALHNVAAGLGVFEGNSGDLRSGLPMQSIHDGTRFMHEPRRLAVFIEAARHNIDAVLAANPQVRQLFDNGWIHLHALEGSDCHSHTPQGWHRMTSAH